MDGSLEDLVAEFLERREIDSSLTAAQFANEHPRYRDELLRAIESVKQVVDAMVDSDPDLPTQIGPYKVLGELGRGGMGIVYEVERDATRFALKLIPVAPLVAPRIMERFRREIQALKKLAHPNIVGVYDSGSESGAPYFVMDLIKGKPLSELTGKVDCQQAADLVRTLATTMGRAHEQGIVHRDLKPQNVMLGEDGRPILLDFGLMTAEDLPSLTSTGDVIGTPRYMSPEQVGGAESDARTDIYALGMILFELVTGRPAYPQPSRDTVMRAVSSGDYPRPRKTNPDTPRDLEKIILKASALSPKHRYQTAEDLSDDLERFLEGRPVMARPPGPILRAVGTARREPQKALVGVLIVVTALLVSWIALDQQKPVGTDASVVNRDADQPSLPPEISPRSPEDPPLSAEIPSLSAEIPSLSPEILVASNAAMIRGLELWMDRKFEDATPYLERSVALDPFNRIARVLLAELRETPLVADPNDPVIEPIVEALRLHSADRHQEAFDALTRARELDPRDPLATVLSARIACFQRKWDVALDLFASVEDRLPSSSYVARKMAYIYRIKNRLDESVETYRRAMTLDPDSTRIPKELAESLYRQGDHESALIAIEDAGASEGDAEDSIVRFKAEILNAMARRAEARVLFRRVLDRNPDDLKSRYGLAYSLDQDHLGPEALAEYDEVIRRNPRHIRARVHLANLLIGASSGECANCDKMLAEHPEILDTERAKEIIIKALDLDRGQSATDTEFALDATLKLEDRTAVIACVEKIVKEDPPSAARRRMQTFLQHLKLRE